MSFELDHDELFEEAKNEVSGEYRDPLGEKYGDPEKNTETQEKVWDLLQSHGIQRFGVVGGKGAGKSFLGACWCLHFAQKYPESLGCIVANDKQQARDGAGENIIEVANRLGFQAEYFRSKKIDSQQRSTFYGIDLDGRGIDQGKTHIILLRSLQVAKSMEGSEFDFMFIDEIQDAEKGDVQVALTRVRGDKIAGSDEKNPIFVAGMTDSELHWMYPLMEDGLGLAVEDNFDVKEDDGVLFEPTVFENKQNLGEATISSMQEMMDARTAEKHIHAKRISSKQNRVFHEYRDQVHRKGRMSELCAYYDPHRELIMSVDFNVSPMSASLWQKKPWSDAWLDDNIVIDYDEEGNVQRVREFEFLDGFENKELIAEYDRLEDFSSPHTEVLAQVDEYEIWPDDEFGGGTDGLMRNFLRDYKEKHKADYLITGDAQGQKTDTRSGTTDWEIIRDHAMKLRRCTIVPGTVSHTDIGGGETTYENPRVRDSVNLLNRLLMNANGNARICFLPESDLESGGVAASIASLERKPNGDINKSPDKREGREKRRSHFADTVRYVAWYWKDGSAPTGEQFEQMIDDLGGSEYPEEVEQHLYDEDLNNGGTTWF